MGGSQVWKLRLAEPSVLCKKRRLGIPTETMWSFLPTAPHVPTYASSSTEN